ncbi:MAG: hypothetical protein QY331_07620 [Melioribacteraceae bacterium]|nr:MAG: hypothetical protein QY331_07620 [Melioribacteraceae bacterium]
MNWKNILPIAFILILIIILLLISNSIIQSCNESSSQYSNIPSFHHSADTIYAKPDTILLFDTVKVNQLSAQLDTVYIDSTRIISAAADTTFQKDSSRISVKYFFPPLNYFEIAADLKERIITKVKTITEVKEFEKPIPLFKNEFFYSSVVLAVLLVLSLLK